ncbi:MAG: sigma-70 family RNA polymerase sigma factor [Bacteroidota bacterium]
MTKSPTIAEADLVEALRRGDEKAFVQVYRNYYHMVASFVQKNSGTEIQAKDLFQELLFTLVKKFRQRDFQLTVKLSTYIFSVARNKWLQQLRKNKSGPLRIQDNAQEYIIIEEDELEVKQQFEKKHELLGKLFKEVKEECREIIKSSFYQKLPHDQIAEKMGYSPAFVRVKLHRCMEGLRKKVRQHPDFHTI